MKKYTKNQLYPFVLILLSSLIILNGCAKSPKHIDISATQVYDISANEMAVENLQRFLNGEKQEEPLVLKIPAGFSLPVHLAVDTPLITMDNDAGKLRFTQDVFLYLHEDRILASPDGAKWGNISDLDILKELFGADQGSIAISMSSSKEMGPLLSFSVLLKPNKSQ